MKSILNNVLKQFQELGNFQISGTVTDLTWNASIQIFSQQNEINDRLISLSPIIMVDEITCNSLFDIVKSFFSCIINPRSE